MKSRISIDVDFDNQNQPVIRLIYQYSDDTRDKLVCKFLQDFGGDSSWARISYEAIPDGLRVILTPVKPEELWKEAEKMRMAAPAIKGDVNRIPEPKTGVPLF